MVRPIHSMPEIFCQEENRKGKLKENQRKIDEKLRRLGHPLSVAAIHRLNLDSEILVRPVSCFIGWVVSRGRINPDVAAERSRRRRDASRLLPGGFLACFMGNVRYRLKWRPQYAWKLGHEAFKGSALPSSRKAGLRAGRCKGLPAHPTVFQNISYATRG